MPLSRNSVYTHPHVQTRPSPPSRTKDSELLSKIREELWNKARNAANNIRVILDDLDELAGYRCTHYDEWLTIRKDFVDVVKRVRHIANNGALQISDVLGPLMDLLNSQASSREKLGEIASTSNRLKNLMSDLKVPRVESDFIASCDRIIEACRSCHISKCHGSNKIRAKVKDVSNKAQQLIKLEISLDKGLDAVVDTCTGSIVKVLVRLVSPSTGEAIITSIGGKDGPRIVPCSGPKSVKMNINVVAILISAGNLLHGDFKDVQKQYNDHTGEDDFKKQVLFVLGLYKHLEIVLKCFGSECNKEGAGQAVMTQEEFRENKGNDIKRTSMEKFLSLFRKAKIPCT